MILTEKVQKSIPQKGISHTSYLCTATLPVIRVNVFGCQSSHAGYDKNVLDVNRLLRGENVLDVSRRLRGLSTYLTLVVSYGAYQRT